MRSKRRIPFLRNYFWPVYSREEIVHDKCMVAELTHNSFHDCDMMFLPEFFELVKYVSERVVQRSYSAGGEVELSDMAELPN